LKSPKNSRKIGFNLALQIIYAAYVELLENKNLEDSFKQVILFSCSFSKEQVNANDTFKVIFQGYFGFGVEIILHLACGGVDTNAHNLTYG